METKTYLREEKARQSAWLDRVVPVGSKGRPGEGEDRARYPKS